MAEMSEDERMMRQLYPHMFDDGDSCPSGGNGELGMATRPVKEAAALEPIEDFIARLEAIESTSDFPPGSHVQPEPAVGPAFLGGGHAAKTAAEWLDRPDLLRIEESEKRVVAQLRSLPPLDPKRLEEGLTRL